jgi:CheY-like chemotaxis protein
MTTAQQGRNAHAGHDTRKICAQDLNQVIGSLCQDYTFFELDLASGIPFVESDWRKMISAIDRLLHYAADVRGAECEKVVVRTRVLTPSRGSAIVELELQFASRLNAMVMRRDLSDVVDLFSAHDACLRIGSRGDNASFRGRLPAVGRRADSTPETRRGTLLLVDDDPLVLRPVSRLLCRHGYCTMLADSGQEAIELFTAHHAEINAVMVDLIMPQMDAAELIPRLRAIDATVPIILASGYTRDSRVEGVLKLGCRGFIQKPFEIAQLASVLDDAIHAPSRAALPISHDPLLPWHFHLFHLFQCINVCAMVRADNSRVWPSNGWATR